MVLLADWHIQLHIPNDLPDEAVERLEEAFADEVRAATDGLADRLCASTGLSWLEVRVQQ